MEIAEKYKQQLLEQIRRTTALEPISARTEDAYLATPRHAFVRRYRQGGMKQWQDVDEGNLTEHLATLYRDWSLALFGDDDDPGPSTISQPSLVLKMLDILQLESGHTVLELGAGSGWNAALIARLVGPEGRVYSLEIIPEVARQAAENLAALDIHNAQVIEGDGGEGHVPGGPYDRVVFTAGTYDLPQPLFEQMKDGGLMLVVIKTQGGLDNLFLLRKTQDHFESVESRAVGFVPLTGKYSMSSLDPIFIEILPEWAELRQQEVSETPFWWGGKGSAEFVARTAGIRSFLSIAEPFFRVFKTLKATGSAVEERYFGLLDRENGCLVIARDDRLIAYGNEAAKDRLLQRVHQWVDLGMPSAASFDLRVYPSGHAPEAGANQWIIRRNESDFLWSLEA